MGPLIICTKFKNVRLTVKVSKHGSADFHVLKMSNTFSLEKMIDEFLDSNAVDSRSTRLRDGRFHNFKIGGFRHLSFSADLNVSEQLLWTYAG
jgi:FixJ family two-component response regulator